MKRPIAVMMAMSLLGTAAAEDAVTLRLRTDPLMMPYYTGSILPTPQKAEYRDEFLPLASVAIVVGKDVENPAPLVAVLTDRITRYGGTAAVAAPGAQHTAVISLGETELVRQAKELPAVPEQQEGYVLHAARIGGKPAIILKGHDRLGLLWAISSLTQLIHWREGRTVARAATVVDFPHAPQRGFIHGYALWMFFPNPRRPAKDRKPDTEQLLALDRQFLVAFKLNRPVYQMLAGWFGDRNHPEDGYWRTPEKWKPEFRIPTIERIGAHLAPLGITWYGSVHPHTGEPEDKLCGDEETVQALLGYARRMEAAGGHLSVILDDVRFPIHPYDKKQFGTAREADTFILTRVMERLKKEYPQARLLVCPPFYWGPVGRVSPEYGESRDDYLKMIGEKWPPEIDVFWTGQQVNGMPLAKKEYVEWITGLIRRKPFLWQNSAVTWYHAYNRHYGTDAIDTLRTLYWPGFLKSIGWYGVNSHIPDNYLVNAISADFQWNPDAYDPQRSVREAAGRLARPEAWELLERYNQAMSFFDRYPSSGYSFYAIWRENAAARDQDAARNIDTLEARMAEVEAVLKEMKERFPAMSHWAAFEGYAGTFRGYTRSIKADPKLRLHRAAVEQRTLARKAGHFDPERDLFWAAADFTGAGLTEVPVDPLDDTRLQPAYVLSGPVRTTETKFPLTKEQAAGAYALWLHAQKGENADRMTLTLNGKAFFAEATPFGEQGPSFARFNVPAGLLKEGGNALAVSVTSREKAEGLDPKHDVGVGAAPLLAIHYAVLRRLAPPPRSP